MSSSWKKHSGTAGTVLLLIFAVFAIFMLRMHIFSGLWFMESSSVWQAFYATVFTWLITALGAGCVFIFRDINRRTLTVMLGFSAGVMIAASYWSLLAPSIALAEQMGGPRWVPPLVGFLSGGAFLWGVDQILPHLHKNLKVSEAEGVKTSWRRTTLLVSAITLHNFPEGLAVGVAFGAAGLGLEGYNISQAVALALGIGLQNLPEGMSVSIPMRREGKSVWKSFMVGQASGLVEPVAGVLGACLVLAMRSALPYALSFAAGAMIYVVIEELIPEAQSDRDTDSATIGAMIGFALMMTMDVAL